jgi:hypothetical protein
MADVFLNLANFASHAFLTLSWKILSPQQTFLNMNDQTTSPNGVTMSPTAFSGNQGAVAQLDDTGRGMSGNIRHLEECQWKNNNNKSQRNLNF